MRIALRGGFILLVALPWAYGASAVSQAESTSDKQIAELIEQLNAQANTTREIAEARLLEIGEPAKTRLQAALTGPNVPEIHVRARRLLAKLEHSESCAKQRAIRHRIDDFTADNPGSVLWKIYCQIVGDDADSRHFFIGMLQRDPLLLTAYDEGAEKAAAEFERYWFHRDANRIAALFPQIQIPLVFPKLQYEITQPRSLETTATLLLLANDKELQLPEPLVCRLIDETNWSLVKDSAPLRKIFLHWLQFPVDSKHTELFKRKIFCATNLNLKETIDWLVAVTIDPSQTLERRLEALLAIQRFETSEQRNQLEPILQDTTAIKDGTPLSDIVLAQLLKITGKTWKEYGYPDETPNFLASRDFKKLGFQKAKTRQKTMARWNQWAKEDNAWCATVEAFAGDLDGSKKLSLPGWERFQRIMGSDPQAREFFAQMQRVDREILAAYDKEPAKVNDLLKTRFQNLWVTTPPALGTSLFLALDENVDLSWHFQQPLSQVLSHPDYQKVNTPSIRTLLAKIEQRNLERTAYINAFAQDTQGIWKLSLPGWTRYRQLLGESPASRRFFAEMHCAEPKLLKTYGLNPEAAAEQLANSLERMKDHPQAFSVAALAAILLVVGDERVKGSSPAFAPFCESLKHQKHWVREAMFGSQVFHKLLATWINTPSDDDAINASKRSLALIYDLPETVPYFLARATNPQLKAEARIEALLTLAVLAGKEQIPCIEPLLKDKAACEHEQKRIELRDMALAVLVRIREQSLTEYGFRAKNNDVPMDLLDPELLLDNPGLRSQFDLADRREDALTKWRAQSDKDQKLQLRLAAFAKGDSVQLPGWKLYRKIVGDTSRSRKLFCEMQRALPEILAAHQQNPAQAAQIVEATASRTEQVAALHQQRSRESRVPLGYQAAMLLVAADQQANAVKTNTRLQHDFANDQVVFDTVQNTYPEEIKKLLGRWLVNVTRNGGDIEHWNKVYVVHKFKLKDDGIAMLTHLLKNQEDPDKRGQFWLHMRPFFLSHLILLTDRSCTETVQFIESYLDDETKLPLSEQGQMRDLAIAGLVRLTDQQFEDYGLSVTIGTDNAIDGSSKFFTSPKAREMALKKWKAWSKANLKELKKS